MWSVRIVRSHKNPSTSTGWLQRLWNRWTGRGQVKNKRIGVAVSQAEYDEFSAEAKRAGITLSEWARKKLRGDLKTAPPVLEEAFRQLDVSDHKRDFSRKPLPPEVEPPEQRLVSLGKRLRSDHSCVHYAIVQRDDGGHPQVCMNSSQFGRPCYWSSARAFDCTMFDPRQSRKLL